MLPFALSQRIGVHVFLGRLTEATALREELNSVTDATGDPPPPLAALLLAAWQRRGVLGVVPWAALAEVAFSGPEHAASPVAGGDRARDEWGTAQGSMLSSAPISRSRGSC
jgi:hypothetical protein